MFLAISAHSTAQAGHDRGFPTLQNSQRPTSTATLQSGTATSQNGTATLQNGAVSLPAGSSEAILSIFASLPADWQEALVRLAGTVASAEPQQLPQQLHGQLLRAWAALACLLARATPDLTACLQAYLTLLAANCKVRLLGFHSHCGKSLP